MCNFVAPLSHQMHQEVVFITFFPGSTCLILDLDILWQGVSTLPFASVCGLVDCKPFRADPLVFERGLVRVRAAPSDFEGRSTHV